MEATRRKLFKCVRMIIHLYDWGSSPCVVFRNTGQYVIGGIDINASRMTTIYGRMILLYHSNYELFLYSKARNASIERMTILRLPTRDYEVSQ
jgi:hypothetical protein